MTFANEATGGRGSGFAGPAQAPPPIQISRRARLRPPKGRARRIRSVTPSPEAVTLREHYSRVELPDNNYKPREDDPRAGYFGSMFVDYQHAHRRTYAAPLWTTTRVLS